MQDSQCEVMPSADFTQKKYITKKNVVSFALGGFGLNLIGSTINTYILLFYTDVFLLSLPAVTTLMLVARIFDAFNDPIMGIIVDKTRTRMGKMRPYLLITIVPIGLITVLLFLAPNISTGGKIVYAYATYLIYSIIYTMCDIPMWGMATAITPNAEERVKFISFTRLIHTIGAAVPIGIFTALAFILKDKVKMQYFLMGISIAIIGSICYSMTFFGCKERTTTTTKAPSIKDCFKSLKINRPLLTLVLANVLGFMRPLCIVGSMYIAVYFLGGSGYHIFFVGAWSVTGYLGIILTPVIAKKWDYRKMFIVFSVLGAIFSLIFGVVGQFVDYTQIVFLMVFMFLGGFSYGVVTSINYAMASESVDYVEWKTGERTEGITLSMQTLMQKLMMALQNAIVPAVLIIIKFVQPISVGDELVTQVQAKGTMDGMFFMISFLPCIGWVLSLIPIFFYNLVGKERDRVYAELALRREAKEKEELMKTSE